MPLQEIFWRLNTIINQPNLSKISPLDDALVTRELGAAPNPYTIVKAPRPALSQKEAQRIEAEAKASLNHEVTLFGTTYKLGEKIKWLTDPENGVATPRKDFMSLNYRSLKNVSVMRIWWLNRHYHLVPVAQYFAQTGEKKYLDEVINQLSSWMEECAYPNGIVWCNAMEPAMRLLSWCFIYRFLTEKKPAPFSSDFARKFLYCVRQTALHIDFNRSRYSSDNNHSLAELTSLLAAKATFPTLFKDDFENSGELLKQEASLQFSENGVNREQALSYHAFSLELLCVAGLFSESFRKDNLSLYAGASDFLINALEVMPLCGEYGDSDEAKATGIIPRDENYYCNVALLAAQLAKPNPELASELENPIQWYTGAKLPEKLFSAPYSDYSKECGVFWNGETSEGLKLNFFFRTGSLGYGQLAAHGHADLLEVLLAVDGKPVFIDCGTGAYHGIEKWREYFRSTMAHNTLVAEEQSQSISQGPFIWDNNFYCLADQVDLRDDGFELRARHDGYAKRFSLVHRRTVAFQKNNDLLQFKDETLECDNVNTLQIFHVAPNLKVEKNNVRELDIIGETFTLHVNFYHATSVEIISGEESRPMGVFSKHLRSIEPCTSILAKGSCLGQDSMMVTVEIKRK